MSVICDLCGKRPGRLTDRTVVNNGVVEFHFCEECYDKIRRSGMTALEVMSQAAARLGKECPVCGFTAEDFARTFSSGVRSATSICARWLCPLPRRRRARVQNT